MSAEVSGAHALLERLRATTASWAGRSISDPRESGEVTASEWEVFRKLGADPADAEQILAGSVTRVWVSLATEMLDAARRYEANSPMVRSVPDHVLVTALDTELVNAASYACGDGSALIVLNDALVKLAYEVCRVLATLVVAPGETPADDVTEDAQRGLVSVLDWIRVSGHVHAVDLPLDGPRLRIAVELCLAMEEFVIAHEVSHLVLGHHAGCMGSRQILIEVPSTEPIPDPDYQRQELEADCFAMLMVLDLRSKRSEHNDQTLALDGFCSVLPQTRSCSTRSSSCSARGHRAARLGLRIGTCLMLNPDALPAARPARDASGSISLTTDAPRGRARPTALTTVAGCCSVRMTTESSRDFDSSGGATKQRRKLMSRTRDFTLTGA
jgi:hypothetical protein